MPAVSKAQQRFMAMVRATQKGELKDPPEAVERAAKSMTKRQARDFAKTKHKGLPERVEKDAAFFDEMFIRGYIDRMREK